MNNALRKRHRIMVSLLAVFMPVIFISGIFLREPINPRQELPEVLSVSPILPKNDGKLIAVYNDLWEALPIQLKIMHSLDEPKQKMIELSMQETLSEPDLLVYWYPSLEVITLPDDKKEKASLSQTIAIENILLKEAIFLGAFYQSLPTVLPLPPDLKEGKGRLILYSLPFREVVSISRPIDLLGTGS